MFKIHQLFVSKSSYKTGNVWCFLNMNLEFIGSVSVSVIRDRVFVRVESVSGDCVFTS